MDGGKMCEVFLKEEESYRAVADRLVQIAHCYGFDGWLINIENPLGVSFITFNSLLFCTKLVYCCAIETLVFIMLWVR
jgi:hypothetical protein